AARALQWLPAARTGALQDTGRSGALMFGLARKLAANGVLGINARNCQYILRHNPRRLYPLVDDKLATKRLAIAAGLPVPDLYGVIASHRDVRELPKLV